MTLRLLLWLMVFAAGGAPANGQSYPWLEAVREPSEKLSARHPMPAGYQRIPVEAGSFAHFLRHLPLKPEATPLRLYNGQQHAAAYAGAIIDLDLSSRDLQQCADTLIRLFAEYRYSQGAAETLTFNFTSGDAFAYKDYLAGRRPVVNGGDVAWRQEPASAPGRQAFRRWLDIVFLYAGTASLARDLPRVDIEQARIGDLFISPGFPGHTVMIADMAASESGSRKVLLVQGFTPAQDAHVVRNLQSPLSGDWYDLSPGEDLNTPVWRFRSDQLHRMP